VCTVVRQQVAAGIDVPNDGEYTRRGFTSYIHERLAGLEPVETPSGDLDQTGHRHERDDFPDFCAQYDKLYRTMWMLPGVDMSDMQRRSKSDLFKLTGALSYKGREAAQHDIGVLRDALQGESVADAFVTAVTPAITRKDRGILDFYPNQRAYLDALADALHDEYRLITDAGLIVQLDVPQLEHSISSSADRDRDDVCRSSRLARVVGRHRRAGRAAPAGHLCVRPCGDPHCRRYRTRGQRPRGLHARERRCRVGDRHRWTLAPHVGP
jgi:methionine synthase II (cobalamin-independent)